MTLLLLIMSANVQINSIRMDQTRPINVKIAVLNVLPALILQLVTHVMEASKLLEDALINFFVYKLILILVFHPIVVFDVLIILL
jgi:hypothetical protein